MAILSVNAGSSSLKFSLYPVTNGAVQPALLSGNMQGLEPGGQPTLSWSRDGVAHEQALPTGTAEPFAAALQSLVDLLGQQTGLPPLTAVAHRVVHGGALFTHSVVVTDDVLAQLAKLNSLAPLHQPHNLEGIRSFQRVLPKLPQVACFDTAFHATLSDVAGSFPLPQELVDMGIKRYGFHGLSYQYVAGVLARHSTRGLGRVLMAHLGNGASLCAAVDGRSVATTMGFSALDGLMMGTRTGALDAGVVLYLLEQGWDHKRLQTLLYKQSGLLGVSGISADMRRLRADGSPSARKAIDLFTHRVVRESGAMVACSQGLDVLAFSGGIGEHDVQLRADVCQQLAWLGVSVDAQANQAAVGNEVVPIHAPDSTVEVWVVPTDEGMVAAEEAARLIS
ncbi:MAG: acetate/propionate family kinase [Burkholderiales bacterium]|nr:acetate/propionate family kinase [Burkholderiales bacterium]